MSKRTEIRWQTDIDDINFANAIKILREYETTNGWYLRVTNAIFESRGRIRLKLKENNTTEVGHPKTSNCVMDLSRLLGIVKIKIELKLPHISDAIEYVIKHEIEFHHKDGDPLNNNLSNLQQTTALDHDRRHRYDTLQKVKGE